MFEGMCGVRRWMARIGIGLGVLLVAAVAAATLLAVIGSSSFDRRFTITPEPLAIPTDADAWARGRHLEAAVLGCHDCHGDDLGGDLFLAEPGLFEIHAPNLTAGRGGVGASYSDLDWVRAIRHGVAPDGKGLLFMPADVFHHLSADDLASVIAYVQGVPPVDRQVPDPTFGLMGRILVGLRQLPETLLVPALGIEHGAPIPSATPPDVSAGYGAYLASIAYCTLCHGSDLTGGPFPFPDPDAPPVPSLAAAGGWTAEQFASTLRTGVTPSGRPLDQAYMPWGDYAMTDEELEALWLHVRSLMGAAR